MELTMEELKDEYWRVQWAISETDDKLRKLVDRSRELKERISLGRNKKHTGRSDVSGEVNGKA